MAKSTMLDLRKFFTEGSSIPVGTTEFSAFWKSLTDEQKEQYKTELDEIRGL